MLHSQKKWEIYQGKMVFCACIVTQTCFEHATTNTTTFPSICADTQWFVYPKDIILKADANST